MDLDFGASPPHKDGCFLYKTRPIFNHSNNLSPSHIFRTGLTVPQIVIIWSSPVGTVNYVAWLSLPKARILPGSQSRNLCHKWFTSAYYGANYFILLQQTDFSLSAGSVGFLIFHPNWLPRFAGLVRFEQNASNHDAVYDFREILHATSQYNEE